MTGKSVAGYSAVKQSNLVQAKLNIFRSRQNPCRDKRIQQASHFLRDACLSELILHHGS